MSWSARVVSAAALRAVILALVAVSLAARADISPAQLLVAGGKGCDSPAWSPDGTQGVWEAMLMSSRRQRPPMHCSSP